MRVIKIICGIYFGIVGVWGLLYMYVCFYRPSEQFIQDAEEMKNTYILNHHPYGKGKIRQYHLEEIKKRLEQCLQANDLTSEKQGFKNTLEYYTNNIGPLPGEYKNVLYQLRRELKEGNYGLILGALDHTHHDVVDFQKYIANL